MKIDKMTAAAELIKRVTGIDAEDVWREYVGSVLWRESCYGWADDMHDGCRGEGCDISLDSIGFTFDDIDAGESAAAKENLYDYLTGCVIENPAAFDGMTAEMIGHNHCLSQNGHGSGWWDLGLDELGDWLHRQSKSYGEIRAEYIAPCRCPYERDEDGALVCRCPADVEKKLIITN